MTVFALTWIGLICWCVCFWWMHRISARQDALLKELHDITTRIEGLSKAEHDMIRDVHPKVREASSFEPSLSPNGNCSPGRFCTHRARARTI